MYRQLFYRSWMWLGLLVLLVLPGAARAEAPAPLSGKAVTALNNRLRQAIDSFNAERFEEARLGFLEVYQRRQDPRLLFNLGSCYRRLNQVETATEYYEQFVKSVPDSPLIPEARAYIVELHARLDADKSAADRQQNEIKLRIAEQRAKEAENIARANEEARKRAEAELVKQSQKETRPVYKRAWFWVVVGGVAAAAIATGVGVGLYEKNKNPPEPGSDLGPQPVRF